jgi:hypothetical protein
MLAPQTQRIFGLDLRLRQQTVFYVRGRKWSVAPLVSPSSTPVRRSFPCNRGLCNRQQFTHRNKQRNEQRKREKRKQSKRQVGVPGTAVGTAARASHPDGDSWCRNPAMALIASVHPSIRLRPKPNPAYVAEVVPAR